VHSPRSAASLREVKQRHRRRIAFPKSNRPDGPRADGRIGDD
jgi:hypothetical protein